MSEENDEARMSNDETRTKLESLPRPGRRALRHSLIPSSFVTRHSSLSAILGALFLSFASTAFATEILEDVDEQKYDVNPDVTLSVSNTDGSIRIYGAEQPVITVEAIKRAYDPERLEAIVVDVKASRDHVEVTTKF